MPDGLEQHRPLARLLVRLLGVFFVIEGATCLVGYGIDLLQQWRLAREYSTPFMGTTALGMTIASVVEIAAGLVLIFRSRVAMDALYYERLEDPGSKDGD